MTTTYSGPPAEGTRGATPAPHSQGAALQDTADGGQFVRISIREYTELLYDAGQWRLLRTSPHVASLLDEFAEWDRRRQLRESSWDIAATPCAPWHAPTYAELERRRAEVVIPEWAERANAELARRRGVA